MPMITLQFGQCGNQVGHSFFSLLSRDIKLGYSNEVSLYCQESVDNWFQKISDGNKYLARAILVDTEQKVINDIKKKQSGLHWEYNSNNVISSKGGGTGNNWAFGYGKKGPELKETVLECVRKNIEDCDMLHGFVNILSCAGGTGSGVGSYIIEELYSEYPSKLFISSVVLPYSAGEVITQNYNTVLTLAKLYDVTDMFIVFSNDQLHKMSNSLLKKDSVILQDLNDLIAMKLGSIFQPISDTPLYNFNDIISQLAAHIEYKFVTIKSAPHYPEENKHFEPGISWNLLSDHMKQTLKESEGIDWETKSIKSKLSSRHSQTQYVKCIGNVLITRGEEMQDSGAALASTFNDISMYPQWVPEDAKFQHFHQNRKYLEMNKFISLATNNSSIYHAINGISENAWKVYTHKAHVTSGRGKRLPKHKIDSYATVQPLLNRSLTFSEWPESEKLALLEGLKRHGPYDLDSLCEAVPGKSRDNIKMALAMWWKTARTAMLTSSRGRKNVEGVKKANLPKVILPVEKAPIDQWLMKLENSQAAGSSCQSKLLARTLLYISKYESHPRPEDCNGVDFKALYEFMYAMMRGFPGKNLNAETSAYLLKSIKDIEKFMNERGKVQEMSFLEKTQRITEQDKVLRTYGGKRVKLESAVEPNLDEKKFKELLEIPGFNPLKVKAELLKK
ncbi:hypothetical protein L9F63_008782 [Diploptera punctata]|uniref:Tubulin delta chain n=1 Tax=Diploptera punctata TaxID=6984 RepID=A0AAD7Z4M8_DIPPU|nr:hypothetical protein L9F63_008782 [Diploptera punctata]